jgi:phosphate transport system substrate-binding protein
MIGVRVLRCLAILVWLVCRASGDDGAISIKGSDTMVVLAQKWAVAYMAENPGVSLRVNGGGTGAGLAALQNRTTDLAFASRPIHRREIEGCIRAFSRRPAEHAVAFDGITVYVHASNPVQRLTLDQLAGIYTGRLQRWSDVGGADEPIVLYSRENSSGTYEFFKMNVLLGNDFAVSAQTLQGTSQVVAAVGRDRTGIGYGGSAFAHGTRPVAIAAAAGQPYIAVSEASVASGKYPISRQMYVYLDPSLMDGRAGQFVRWIQGDNAQRIVKEAGFFPLRLTASQ